MLIHIIGDEQEGRATAMCAVEERGCDPGMAPAGGITSVVRLCRECAMELRLPVGEVAGEVLASSRATTRWEAMRDGRPTRQHHPLSRLPTACVDVRRSSP